MSASTPSQSKIKRRHQALPALPKSVQVPLGQVLDRGPLLTEQRRRVVLPRILVQERPRGVEVGDLQGRGDVDLGAPPRDQVPEGLLAEPRAPVQHHRDRLAGNDVAHPLGVEHGLGRVDAVSRADGRREAVDAGRLEEGHRLVDGVDLALLVRADAVLDAPDALDLALHVRAVPPGLGHHLDRLAGVLVHRQRRPVEEHRVPPGVQAGGDHLALRAVVEVQRHGDARRLRQRPEEPVEDLGAHRLHRLDRGLDDERRADLLGRRDHGVEGEIVDDVERRHAVSLGEGAVEDLLERRDWQRTSRSPGRQSLDGTTGCRARHPEDPPSSDAGSPYRRARSRAWRAASVRF